MERTYLILTKGKIRSSFGKGEKKLGHAFYMICKRLLTFDHGIIRVLDLVKWSKLFVEI
jgi:hypothetical protein